MTKLISIVATLLTSAPAWALPVTLELETPADATGVYFKIENLTVNKCETTTLMIAGDEEGRKGHYHLTPTINKLGCFSTKNKTIGLFSGVEFEKDYTPSNMISIHIDSEYISYLKVYFKKETQTY